MDIIETIKMSFYEKLILLVICFATCALLTFHRLNNVASYVVVHILLFISLNELKKISQK